MLRVAMNGRSLRSLALLSALLAAGCSSETKTAPETIEGKTPADYREEAEQRSTQGIPETPKKGPASKAR